MKVIRDTWLLFARSMKATLRNPAFVILGLFQPVCYMLLFAPLLNNLVNAPGFPSGGALKVFTPGLLILLAMFGAAFVGFDLLGELRYGVVERLRVTPVSRLALLLGRALRDVVNLIVQSLLLLVVAWLMGLRASVAGVALMFVMIVLIGLLMSSFSYAVALAFKDENALSAMLNFIMQPLLLLSGILLPLSLAPLIIRDIAHANPFSYAVATSRALFNGNLSDGVVVVGFAVIATLALLTLYWAARSFRSALS